MILVTFNGNTLDLGPEASPNRNCYSNHIIVRLNDRIVLSQVQELAVANVMIHHQIDNNTWSCTYRDRDFQPIRRLPFVHFAIPYPGGFVVHPLLRVLRYYKLKLDNEQTFELINKFVDVVLHPECEIEDWLDIVLEAADVDFECAHIKGLGIRLMMEVKYLDRVASIDAVASMEIIGGAETWFESH
jgi:hypothetical protein